MTTHYRPYQGPNDLWSIGRLIRQAFAAAPNWNTYSFARFDIWMQFRIADEVLYDKRDWQPGFQLWESDGELIGAVFFESDRDAMLIGHPDHPELIEPMLDWAEAYYLTKGSDQPLMIEAMESNIAQCELLKSRGYTLFPGYFIHRHKPLDPGVIEPVALPAGFSIKPIEAANEWQMYPVAVQAVFHRSATVEQDEFLKQAPSYVPELNLLVWSAQGEVAAFCSVWIDPVNRYAEFEPVGTVPSFQKRGLGLALLAYAHNRLRALGCPLATVQSWNESIGANKLYQAAGLLPKDHQLNWVWPA
jgi:GNAT superfamily N-acetyltransferase